MKTYYTSVAAICAVALASAALSQTTTYKGYDANPGGGAAVPHSNSDAASAQFQSALAGTSTEGFESFAQGTSAPLTLNFAGSAGTLTATLTGGGSVASGTAYDPNADRFPTAGSKYYSVNSSNFQIGFGTPVAAFGFYASDIESNVQLIFTHASGTLETFSFASLFPSVNYGTLFGSPTASVNFLGFINTNDLFTGVTFGQGPNSSGDVLAFDQMTIGDARQVVNPPSSNVPEPATWAMMVGGFGLVGSALRRRSRTAVRFA